MARKRGSCNREDAFRAEAVALVIDHKLPLSISAKHVGVSF
jgi:hypothetical protein